MLMYIGVHRVCIGYITYVIGLNFYVSKKGVGQ
jgi:hypothetical protein